MSKVTSEGLYVSQTIGQQSVIGNHTREGITYGQGFQQSLWGKYISGNIQNNISTVVYPNPFVSEIHFQFSQDMTKPINIRLFDVRGRLIIDDTKKAEGALLTLNLQNIADSNYLVRLSSD